MPKEQFLYPETKPIFDLLEETTRRSGVSRAQAFEDFLHMTVCALGHPLMEDEYLATVAKHSAGNKGKRGVDTLARMFASLIEMMEKTRQDILGDLFQGAISYGEQGQFLTPEPICDMLAAMNLPPEPTGIDGRRSVNDPCCGSGRMLLAAAKLQPNWHFVGQDVDLRCVRMTAINLALRNYYGHVVCGNSLSNTRSLIYETGRVQVWGNAIRKVGHVPLPDRAPEEIEMIEPDSEGPAPEQSPAATDVKASADQTAIHRSKQLRLF